MPTEDRDERRRRDLEEILELRRSFGTLGRRLGTRQGPVRPGLAPSQGPSAEAGPDAGAKGAADPPADQDQEKKQDQGQERIPATPRRAEPVAGDLFQAPDPPATAAKEPFRIPDPPAAERRLPWPWLVGLVAVFALGVAVDHAVLQPDPRPAPSVSTQAQQAPSAPPSSAAPATPPASVPRSCLLTAQRGDVLIDMLVKKRRGVELARALKAYTLASQSCRKEASS